MAKQATSGKNIQELESDIATIRLSGAVSTGNDSDTETSSDSEQENQDSTQSKENTPSDSVPSRKSKSASVTALPNTESGNVIAQVMVNSSDSGCPTSPKDLAVDSTGTIPSQTTECNGEADNKENSNIHRDVVNGDENVRDSTSQGSISGDVKSDEEIKSINTVDSAKDDTFPSREDSTGSVGSNSPNGPMSPTRFNPFDKDDVDEQDPFPQLGNNSLRKSRVSDSSSSWSNDEPKDGSADSGYSNAGLGITEDYFAQPEGHFGALSITEMEEMIAECRTMVLEAPPDSERRKTLVHKLVQLRLKLAEAKEEDAIPEANVKTVMSHKFELKAIDKTHRYCEQCNSAIWGVIQGWYRCSHCGFCCHEKCIDLVARSCAILKVKESPEYILNICPEKSLSSQNYKCAECRAPLSFHSRQGEPRLCDYTGNFYCDRCHWNDLIVIPARVLHNWDFEFRKVCRGTKQFLKLMRQKAVLRVQDINPMLFNFVEELNEVKKLREEILIMKKYFMSCKSALQSKLLLQLQERQHFVENSDMYALQDLYDVATDVLLPELTKIHASFAQHIKTDCHLCKAQGYICELCDDHDVLFPFDNIAIVCSLCSTVLHRHCYMRRNQKCPKCLRINARTE